MTRDEWIRKARVLLAGNPRAAELLAATPEASVVVEAEIIEEDDQGEPEERREPVVTLHIAPEQEDQLEKVARRASRFMRFMDDGDDQPLRGTARLNQKIGKAYEDGVDKVLDKMEDVSKIAPPLDRAGAFGRRRK
jgi:hypothetical protein